jgi:uncharacterized phiE125 gp8 family phage protein
MTWGWHDRYFDDYFNRYGSLRLTEASPPQAIDEPLTLDEVKKYLRLPERSPVDQDEDDEILGLISAARDIAEIHQQRDLVRKQWDLHFDYWPSYRISLRSPLHSVDLVQYKDSDGNVTPLVLNTDYIVDPAKEPAILTPPYNVVWPTFTPWPSSSILIRFSSGYSFDSVFWQGPGARIKNGMKLLISAWFNGKLPFEKGASASQEYPYAVTACLGYGARERVH